MKSTVGRAHVRERLMPRLGLAGVPGGRGLGTLWAAELLGARCNEAAGRSSVIGGADRGEMPESPQVLSLTSALCSAIGTMLIQRGLRRSNFYAGFWLN